MIIVCLAIRRPKDMTSKARYNPLTFQVTLTVLALAAFSLAMVIGFGFFATLKADRDSLEKQKIFVTNGIADEIAAVVRQQQSVTVWDDSIINAKAGNQTWMAENLGEWMYAYYGHDRVYILDNAGRPVHAMRDGKTVAPSVYGEERPAIEPSIARLRALIGEAAKSEEPPALVVSDLISFGWPSRYSRHPAPGPEFRSPHPGSGRRISPRLGSVHRQGSHRPDSQAVSALGRAPLAAAHLAGNQRQCSADCFQRPHSRLHSLGPGPAGADPDQKGKSGADCRGAACRRRALFPASAPAPRHRRTSEEPG